jgi:hypothetical protein
MAILASSLVAQTAPAALPDDEAWANVRKLLSGVELRVFEIGHSKPQTVILDEVRQQALIVVVGKEQRAIAREVIEKIELRLRDARKRAKPTAKSEIQQTPGNRPNRTTTGGVTINSQDGNYLIVYRRAVL